MAISDNLMKLLRVRVGLGPDDTTKDTQIQTVYGVSFEWLETFLDRTLEPGTYTEVFTHWPMNILSLKGYPTTSIDSMLQPDDELAYTIPGYHLEPANGLVHFDGLVAAHQLAVTYTCNPQVTGAMSVALLMMFDSNWRLFEASASTEPTGALKVAVIDGMRTEYDTSASSGSGGIDPETGLPEAIAGALRMYRRERA